MPESDRELFLYSLNFKVEDETHLRIVQSWISQFDGIASYSTPIPLLFFIKSYLDSSQLRKKMEFLFPNGNFLICSIDIAKSDGRLPLESWNWFYNVDHGKLQDMSKSTPGTLGLIGKFA